MAAEGFNWKFTTRAFVSKAQETKRALKHGMTVCREGFVGVVDRYTKDTRCSDRMGMGGVDLQTKTEWDDLFARREIQPVSM